MKVPDWKAVAEEMDREMADGIHPGLDVLVAKHTREVPEGLATWLRSLLPSCVPLLPEDWSRLQREATPEVCAAIDADAEAMRVRREVEESSGFESAHLFADGTAIVSVDLHAGLPVINYDRKKTQDAYRAAHEALRKAGKLP